MSNLVSIGTYFTFKELAANLLLTTASPYNYYAAYSVQLPALVKKGSTLIIIGKGEVTNNYAYNVGVGGYLCIGANNSDYNTATCPIIDHATGEDIIDNGTTGHNHIKIDRAEMITLDEDLNNKFINLIVYAYSSSAGGGDFASLMQNSGSLKVFILEV